MYETEDVSCEDCGTYYARPVDCWDVAGFEICDDCRAVVEIVGWTRASAAPVPALRRVG
jgi:hypothetical protein